MVARGVMLRRDLSDVAACTAWRGRGHITQHLAEGWRREQRWMTLFEAALRPACSRGLTSPDPSPTRYGPQAVTLQGADPSLKSGTSRRTGERQKGPCPDTLPRSPQSAADTESRCLDPAGGLMLRGYPQSARVPGETRARISAHSEAKGSSMALYVYQASYTPESLIAQIKEPHDRIETVRPALQAMGVNILIGGYPFGDCDVLVVHEAANDTVAASVAIAVAASGAVKAAKTTRLLSGQEWIESLRLAQASPYRPGR